MHGWPTPTQFPPVPVVQVPLEQVPPLTVQSVQDTPLRPQVVSLGLWQVPNMSMQPLHPVVVHVPLEQVPPFTVQSVQDTPFKPHVVSPLAWQVPVESTQPLHPPVVQLPFEQVPPLAVQSTQAEPFKPQAVLVFAWHTVPLQHPPQFEALQPVLTPPSPEVVPVVHCPLAVEQTLRVPLQTPQLAPFAPH
jgi:hypothetical protein